jgi:hypothetical protein
MRAGIDFIFLFFEIVDGIGAHFEGAGGHKILTIFSPFQNTCVRTHRP